MAATSSGWAQLRAPAVQWDRTLGGAEHDNMRVVCQTADGGYLLAGSSNSPVSPFKSQPRRGVFDYWVIKLDGQGRRQWDRTVSGATGGDSYLYSALQTADGGYILGGHADSGVGNDRTASSRGNHDYWIVKLDAQGQRQWDQAYGGSGPDYLTSLHQTADGGYIVGGYSGSGVGGDKTQPARGITDYWVVKTDAQGNKLWDRTFGGNPAATHSSQLHHVEQTADGGYVLGGFTSAGAGGDKTEPSKGSTDFWLIKLDDRGNKRWDRAYGGADSDLLLALRTTPDGGYILAGTSSSAAGGDKSHPSRGAADYWLVKTDAQGQRQWDRTLGSAEYDYARSVCLAPDGGYIVGGYTRAGASGDKTQPGPGNGDAWLAKVDAQGAPQWDLTLGGADSDGLYQVQPTADGGYILAAFSHSNASADKSEPNLSSAPLQMTDGWLVKLTPPAVRITGPAELCAGVQVQLVAAGSEPALAYRWNTGATTAVLAVGQSGSYAVTAAFAGGFTSTATHQVAAVAAPAISGDSSLCPGQVNVLTASGGTGATYAWSTGATTPALAVNQPGTYAVTVTSAAGCANTARVRVRTVPAVAAFSLGPDTTVCAGQQVRLSVPETLRGVGITYQWSTGAQTPSITVREPGTYALQVSTRCETHSASRVMAFAPCLTLPNIITPNSDRLNDVFEIKGLAGAGWQLVVYNRWGKRVYHTENYQNDWGAAAAAGTYYFSLQHPTAGSVYKGYLQVVR
ncbi:hypothetical protein GCM10023186_17390 [Hymenobacter koreensis]|uniref:Gliding motility-associated C-terminal domain-containing protein n=2 Tax=Hymenobacter koreensis TaxID=1084523 RepID=A0ABP8IY29_9BACT